MTCSSLKEYRLLVHAWLDVLPPIAGWGLVEDVVSVVRVSFLFDWKDFFGVCLIDFSSLDLLFFPSALTLATISFACSPWKTSCFEVWYSATPIWGRSAVCRLWRQLFTNVDGVMLLGYQSAAWISECHASKSLYTRLDRLSFILLCGEESLHKYLCFIFEEASQK